MTGLGAMFKILLIACLLASCFTIVPAAKNAARINNPSRNVGSDDTPPLSIESLITWVAQQYGSQATQWVGLKFLTAIFGGDSSSEQILQELDEVIKNQKTMISDLNEIIGLIKWSADFIDGATAEDHIYSWYNQFGALPNISNPEHRNQTASELAAAILDPNEGILFQLEVLDRVLTNHSTLGPNDQGMITYWGQQNYAQMVDTSSSYNHWTLNSAVTSYIAAVAHLQVLGVTLYCNAIMDDDACNYQLRWVHNNIVFQNQLSQSSVPASTFYLASDSFKNQWQVSFATGVYASYCIYGVPTTSAVYARPRHPNNADEEWLFVEVGDQTGVYNMMVNHFYGENYKMGWGGKYYLIYATKSGPANIKIIPMWGTPTQVRFYDTRRKNWVTLNALSNEDVFDENNLEGIPTVTDFSLSLQGVSVEPPTESPTKKPTTPPTVAPPTATPTERPDKKKTDVSVDINVNVDVDAKK